VGVYVVAPRPLECRSPLATPSTYSSANEGAERFIEDVRGDDPDLASYLRVEERALEAGGRGS
jgi:hypothetical protein